MGSCSSLVMSKKVAQAQGVDANGQCCCGSRPDSDPSNTLKTSASDKPSMETAEMEHDHVFQRRLTNRKGHKDRIGGVDSDGDSQVEQTRFKQHKTAREKSEATKAMLKQAMKHDRICAVLDDAEIEAILTAMEPYEFEKDEVLVVQGETGSCFLCAETGTLEVSVGGKVCNTLKPGTAFGGISLLYNCSRTASVKALEHCSVWGASQATFQQVIKESSHKHSSENRKIIDNIKLLEGLNARQKDSVSDAFFLEVFEQNMRVVTQGEVAATMHVVKRGELHVFTGGTVSSTGKLEGGHLVSRLGPGDCFGERALLQQEERTATVVAAMHSEVLCVSSSDLREVLGTDLAVSLERNLILLCLKKSTVLSQFSLNQQGRIASKMVTKSLKEGEAIGQDVAFVVVLEGAISGKRGEAAAVWPRGQCYESGLQGKDEVRDLKADKGSARVAILTSDALMSILQESGLGGAGLPSAADSAQKIALVRHVHIFRHLSEEQVLKVVSFLRQRICVKGEKVVTEGEPGQTFFVLVSGEVSVTKEGAFIRSMGRNAYFGERSLLLDERRSATVTVTTSEAHLWFIEKDSFSQIVKGNMQADLMKRIALQDTAITMKDIKVIKVIGFGATGVVRLVEHKKTKVRYALKRVKKEKNGTVPPEVKSECELLLENDHPFIMTLVRTFDTPKGVYMLTELITGGELHAAIRQIPTVLSKKQAQFYAGCLFIVLEELAGRSIVYRDLKPENVMLDQQGYLKLIDFGIAKKLGEGTSKTFTMVGTPHYMAPEVMRGQGYGTLVDLWSLGVILFEFVCGYLPFGDELEDPTEVCAAVLKAQLTMPTRYRDPAGKALMQGLLQRQPKKRLGGGGLGYDEVRNSDYFKDGGATSIFDRILGRELDPPLIPKGETYCDPEDAPKQLSDDGELG